MIASDRDYAGRTRCGHVNGTVTWPHRGIRGRTEANKFEELKEILVGQHD